jgi:ankyrin repeat protein
MSEEKILNITSGAKITIGKGVYVSLQNEGFLDEDGKWTLLGLQKAKIVKGNPLLPPQYLVSDEALSYFNKLNSGSPSVSEKVFRAVVPRASPAVVPRASPAVVPRASPAVVPRASPAVVPRASPAVIPRASPAVIPRASPAVIPRASPAVIPRASPAVVPRASPAVVPKVLPKVSQVVPKSPQVKVIPKQLAKQLPKTELKNIPLDANEIILLEIKPDELVNACLTNAQFRDTCKRQTFKIKYAKKYKEKLPYSSALELLEMNIADSQEKAKIRNIAIDIIDNNKDKLPFMTGLELLGMNISDPQERTKIENIAVDIINKNVDQNTVPAKYSFIIDDFDEERVIENGDLPILKYYYLNDSRELRIPLKDLFNDKSLDETPLSIAARTNRLDIVKYLIENGADPNIRFGDYSTNALESAIDSDYLPIVKYLIEVGKADPLLPGNTESSGSESHLYHALKRNNLDLANYLISVHEKDGTLDKLITNYIIIGEDDDVINKPVFLGAVEGKNLDMVKRLIPKDKSILNEEGSKSGTTYGEEALNIAHRNGSTSIYNFLKKYMSTNQENFDEEEEEKNIEDFSTFNPAKVLSLAKETNSINKITNYINKVNLPQQFQYLKELKSGPNARYGEKGWPLLKWAVKNNQRDIVLALLELGANPAIGDYQYSTPLLSAINDGLTDIANDIIDYGIKTGNIKEIVNAPNSSGLIPLFAAVQRRNLDMVKRLIENGADVDALGPYDNNALFIAIKNNDLPMVKYLVSKNIDVNNYNDEGYTALDFARYKNYNDIYNYLTGKVDPNAGKMEKLVYNAFLRK